MQPDRLVRAERALNRAARLVALRMLVRSLALDIQLIFLRVRLYWSIRRAGRRS